MRARLIILVQSNSVYAFVTLYGFGAMTGFEKLIIRRKWQQPLICIVTPLSSLFLIHG